MAEEMNTANGTEGTEGTAQENNQTETTPATGSTPAKAEKLFTQVEVDALIRDRLARERKNAAKQATTAPAATEPTTEAAAVGTTATVEVDVTEDARKQANEIIAKANQRLIQAIAQSEATKLNINPDYIADAVRLADLSTVKVNDDGTVDAKSITTALEAVLQRMPVLKATTEATAGGFKIGGEGGNSSPNGWNSNVAKASGETKRWNKNRY